MSEITHYNDFNKSVHESDDALMGNNPHGSIQWKGTDVCIDLYCKCGAHGHLDTEFLYYYECVSCGTKYALSPNVRLLELTPEQLAFMTKDNFGTFQTDKDMLINDY